MYTNCPECGTVFRISTSELRVAEGYVRCGHCAATFNAVATLTDELPPTVTLEQYTPPDVPDNTAGNAPVPELAAPETGPDPGPDTGPDPGPEITPELTASDGDTPGSGDTLEFDIPEDSWSNFFSGNEAGKDARPGTVHPEPEAAPEAEAAFEAASSPKPSRNEPDSAPPAPPAPADVGDGIGSETVDQVGLYRALAAESGTAAQEGVETSEDAGDDADWQTLLAEVEDDDSGPESVYVISEDPPLKSPPATAAPPVTDPPTADPAWPDVAWEETPDTLGGSPVPAPLPADFAADLPRIRPAGPDVKDADPASDIQVLPEIKQEPLATADRPFLWVPPTPEPARRPGRQGAYAAAGLVLALLLVIQVLHSRRDELATNPSLTAAMQRTYGALGLPLWPAWDLRAYQVRNAEAVADRSAPGALDIMARIAIVGEERVGLPLVRVTLRDGLARPLGTRVFKPAEYLGKNPSPREPVRPGTLIPVEISLQDPGRDALGFDVDVCVMGRRDGVVCRAEHEPFAR